MRFIMHIAYHINVGNLPVKSRGMFVITNNNFPLSGTRKLLVMGFEVCTFSTNPYPYNTAFPYRFVTTSVALNPRQNKRKCPLSSCAAPRSLWPSVTAARPKKLWTSFSSRNRSRTYDFAKSFNESIEIGDESLTPERKKQSRSEIRKMIMDFLETLEAISEEDPIFVHA